MEILVVGGLGYLGSIVVDLLSHDKHNVDVCDICLYENEIVKESIKARNFCKIPIELQNNIEGLGVYDCIVWCATNDLLSFHTDEKLRHYNLNQFAFFKNCVTKSKRFINCSTYQLNYPSNLDSEISKYFLSLEKIVFDHNDESCRSINIRIPSLYGPSPRMRWDTLPNSVILSLLVNQQVIIDKDWKTKVPLAHVVDMALYIKDFVTRKIDVNKMKNIGNFCTDIMSIIEFSHEIGFHMKCKDGYKVEVINDGGCRELDECNLTTWISPKGDWLSLRDSLIDFKKNLEAGNLPDFLSEKYNNEVWISGALNTHHFWKTVGI